VLCQVLKPQSRSVSNKDQGFASSAKSTTSDPLTAPKYQPKKNQSIISSFFSVNQSKRPFDTVDYNENSDDESPFSSRLRTDAVASSFPCSDVAYATGSSSSPTCIYEAEVIVDTKGLKSTGLESNIDNKDKWSCIKCTFLNEVIFVKCFVCGTLQENLVLTSSTSDSASSSSESIDHSSDDEESSVSAVPTWKFYTAADWNRQKNRHVDEDHWRRIVNVSAEWEDAKEIVPAGQNAVLPSSFLVPP